MIKGISRQIIEINETQNKYFEKAWLVVNGEYTGNEENELKNEAQNFTKGLDVPHCIKNQTGVFKRTVKLCAAAVCGSLVTLLFMMFKNGDLVLESASRLFN